MMCFKQIIMVFLFLESSLEADYPKEEIFEILELSRPIVVFNVESAMERLKNSIGFYETCRNAFENSDESIKNALR